MISLLLFVLSLSSIVQAKRLPVISLPIAGIQLKNEADWSEYRAQSAIVDSPFEKIWTHRNQKSTRLISTSFSKTSELCSREKLTLHRQNFLISPMTTKKGFACVFQASRGPFQTFVAIKEIKRPLPKSKKFISQAVLIEQNSNAKSFDRWIASVEEIVK